MSAFYKIGRFLGRPVYFKSFEILRYGGYRAMCAQHKEISVARGLPATFGSVFVTCSSK